MIDKEAGRLWLEMDTARIYLDIAHGMKLDLKQYAMRLNEAWDKYEAHKRRIKELESLFL